MAIEYKLVRHDDGKTECFHNGKLHKEDGPAVIYAKGMQKWFINGELHRDGGPAVIKSNGTEEWYQHGNRHRIGGPAVTTLKGRWEWWVDGKLHREDGPAIESTESAEWFVHGKRHRPDGPALIEVDGDNRKETWYINDRELSKREIAEVQKYHSKSMLNYDIFDNAPESASEEPRDLTFAELEQIVGFKFRLIG